MRLLVVTEFNPGSPGGGPAVVRQMLQGFREAGNELYWWSCRGREKQCQHFGIDGLARFPIPHKLVPARRFPVLKAKLLSGIWAAFATKHLRYTVAQVRPDCIWVIPHNWSILPSYRCLLGPAGVKQRWHTTVQDYPDVHGNELRWGGKLTQTISNQQLALYAQAATRDATSLPMIADLEEKTGATAEQMLHEGLESEDFDYLKGLDKAPKNGSVISIAHVGTVLMEKQFATIIGSLENLRDTGCDVRLHFWSAHRYGERPWFHPSWMFEHGHLEHREMIRALRDCDWGLAVMSDREKDARYNRFSFPTRCLSYMAAGLPSVVWGLPDSAVALMTQESRVGIVLGTAQRDQLDNLLRSALRDDNRLKLQAEIKETASRYFDAREMRCRLWRCLASGSPNESRN